MSDSDTAPLWTKWPNGRARSLSTSRKALTSRTSNQMRRKWMTTKEPKRLKRSMMSMTTKRLRWKSRSRPRLDSVAAKWRWRKPSAPFRPETDWKASLIAWNSRSCGPTPLSSNWRPREADPRNTRSEVQWRAIRRPLFRRYPCPFAGCTYIAKYRSNLWDHKKLHTGEKPYACQWPSCSMRFPQSQVSSLFKFCI